MTQQLNLKGFCPVEVVSPNPKNSHKITYNSTNKKQVAQLIYFLQIVLTLHLLFIIYKNTKTWDYVALTYVF